MIHIYFGRFERMCRVQQTHAHTKHRLESRNAESNKKKKKYNVEMKHNDDNKNEAEIERTSERASKQTHSTGGERTRME